jgi:4-hydroxy-3-methylbut-2-enyl diphosphate reductase
MKVILADALGICFGVRDALEQADRAASPGEVTILGELVHNSQVLDRLDQRGFRRLAENDRGTVPETPQVMITAHGASDLSRARLVELGKAVIDTTCPLVRRVHRAAKWLAAEGRHVIIIGRPGHVEVEGVLEDLPSGDVVDSESAVKAWPHNRLGIICQSTTPPRLAAQVNAAIRRANPQADIRFVDTICQPTRDRQDAVLRLLPHVDVVVVVGGRNSNNTRELAALCRDRGVPAYRVERADELEPAWFAGCKVAGLTAGTSTIDQTIHEVRRALEGLDPACALEGHASFTAASDTSSTVPSIAHSPAG